MTTIHTASRLHSPSPAPERRAWWTIGGILTIAVLLCGIYLAWQVIAGTGLSRETAHSELASEQAPETVLIEGSSADVSLTGGETAQATADLDLAWYGSEQPAVEDSWDQTTWQVSLGCEYTSIPIWFTPGCEIDYDGEIPADAAAVVTLTSGSLTLDEIGGPAELETTSGSIAARQVDGDFSASATSGNIRAEELSSQNAEASTTSGQIEMGFLETPAHVIAEATSGGIEISVPRDQSYRVLTDTSSGQVIINVATDPESSSVLDLRTTSGSITVRYSD